MKAILLSTALLALVACKRDDAPAQTTTTGASVPSTTTTSEPTPEKAKAPEPPKQCMNCDAGFTDPEKKKGTGTGTLGGAPADPGRYGPAQPDDPFGTSLVPRSGSASEAAGSSTNRGTGSGLFGPSLIPAPAAPTSPAGEVNGAGGVTGTGGTTGTGGGTKGGTRGGGGESGGGSGGGGGGH